MIPFIALLFVYGLRSLSTAVSAAASAALTAAEDTGVWSGTLLRKLLPSASEAVPLESISRPPNVLSAIRRFGVFKVRTGRGGLGFGTGGGAVGAADRTCMS